MDKANLTKTKQVHTHTVYVRECSNVISVHKSRTLNKIQHALNETTSVPESAHSWSWADQTQHPTNSSKDTNLPISVLRFYTTQSNIE